MKYSKISLILALAVSLSLLVLVAIPAKPALAQSITLSPISGFVGTKVTVTGRAFYDYKESDVYLYFGDEQPKSVEVSQTGAFTTYFYVPSYYTPGTYYNVTIKNEYGITLTSGRFFVAKIKIELDPEEGRIGDWVRVEGRSFDANKELRIYFSSGSAFADDNIDTEVTTYYKCEELVFTNAEGDFDAPYRFTIPDALTDGRDKEDVHEGNYYIYVTYFLKKRIQAVAKFTVLNGEIALEPEESPVGSEVEISGEGLRQGQKITVKYDEDNIDVASGDSATDSDGKFSCTIIIPESLTGGHTITVVDESGNKPKAEFSVVRQITIAPTSETAGNAVQVSGTGFGEREYVTITFDGNEVLTTPPVIYGNRLGSFEGYFVVPSYARTGTSKVVASVDSLSVAEAQLAILAISATPAGISLRPIISLTSPGHVGMELNVDGTEFIANTMVTITYSNSEDITVATATTDASGNFSVTFAVPPSIAGSHTVTAIDGTNAVISVFTMESESPPMPVPLLPRAASKVEAKAYFDWEDVTDPSGISYILQIGTDADFTTTVLEKEGLSYSEYTISEEEKLNLTEKEPLYYWRVKAIDGAFNESAWTPPGVFYVSFSQTSIPDWAQYIFYGLGALLLGLLGFWVRRRVIQR